MKASYGWAVLGFALAVSAAAAGQNNSGPDRFALGAAGLAPPAETGKPLIFEPPPAPPPAAPACTALLPCGARLLGSTVRRHGAVEIAVPALRW